MDYGIFYFSFPFFFYVFGSHEHNAAAATAAVAAVWCQRPNAAEVLRSNLFAFESQWTAALCLAQHEMQFFSSSFRFRDCARLWSHDN